MTFAVEQQAKSGLGGLHWVRVAGAFETRGLAEATIARRAVRVGAPMRIVEIGE